MAAADPIALVVDDEPVVLKLMARVLERAGYEVLAAADADQALELARELRRPACIAIIDATIPPGGAVAAAEGLLSVQPDAALVFTSGGTLSPGDQAYLSERGGHFLPKPFAPRVLTELVEDAAEGRI